MTVPIGEELAARLPELLPRGIAWAEGVARLVQARGLPLPEALQAEARRVGVRYPERIRVVSVQEMPLPDDPELRAVALKIGVLQPTSAGLTLGYAILIKSGQQSYRLIRHECRHVYQYEQAGGIANFLPVYLGEVLAYGYQEAPSEVDARSYEGDTGSATT